MTDSLAMRRAALIARCAEQRVELALDLQALRARAAGAATPLGMGAAAMLGARLLAHPRLALGAALALVLVRPARLLRLARLAASGWRIVQGGMGLAARFRQ